MGWALAALVLAAAPAVAQDNGPFRVTVNHAEPIRLQTPAAVALIANPDIADIVNERNNLIFVVGRKPGATNLLVYDGAGKQLFNREIVVAPDDGRMVTITRDTDVTTYYCEPHCRFYEHEEGGAPPAAPTAGAGAGVGGSAPAAGAAQGGAAPNAQAGAAPLGTAPAAPQTAGRPGYP